MGFVGACDDIANCAKYEWFERGGTTRGRIGGLARDLDRSTSNTCNGVVGAKSTFDKGRRRIGAEALGELETLGGVEEDVDGPWACTSDLTTEARRRSGLLDQAYRGRIEFASFGQRRAAGRGRCADARTRRWARHDG